MITLMKRFFLIIISAFCISSSIGALYAENDDVVYVDLDTSKTGSDKLRAPRKLDKISCVVYPSIGEVMLTSEENHDAYISIWNLSQMELIDTNTTIGSIPVFFNLSNGTYQITIRIGTMEYIGNFTID